MDGAFQFYADLLDSIREVRAQLKPKDHTEDVMITTVFRKVSSYVGTESQGLDNVQM